MLNLLLYHTIHNRLEIHRVLLKGYVNMHKDDKKFDTNLRCVDTSCGPNRFLDYNHLQMYWTVSYLISGIWNTLKMKNNLQPRSEDSVGPSGFTSNTPYSCLMLIWVLIDWTTPIFRLNIQFDLKYVWFGKFCLFSLHSPPTGGCTSLNVVQPEVSIC